MASETVSGIARPKRPPPWHDPVVRGVVFQILFVAAVWYTRYISFGSIAGAAMFPLGVWMIEHPPAPVLVASIAGGLFIIWRHWSNMERLMAGRENVFTFSKKPS